MQWSILTAIVQASFFITGAFAAFGLTESGNIYTVDTNAGLVFKVDKTTGDITSLLYNGIEAQDQSGKHSQINSGIGASCSWVRTGNSDNYIKISCSASGITQYYIAKYNDPAVHMATYISSEPSVGELRYISRLSKSAVPNGLTVSEVNGGTAIEGSDVYSLNGQTRSKFYSSRQFIDDQVHGVTGSGIGVYMIVPGVGYESASGGPFFRDIDNQGSAQQELYFYMNSGHTQTESYRTGLHGPYALWFTTGSTPSGSIDTSFWEGLGISEYIPLASRGRVSGTASGFPSSYANYMSVGWSNSQAQYWVRTDSSGAFESPRMKPGTYTMTLYKMELAVASKSVTVSANAATSASIASTEANPTVIWQIGDLDGTPRGFLNADKIETMHPSDSRMSSWGPLTFSVGSSVSSFPMALFKAVGPVTINFSLGSSQIGARTLEIATTLAFAGGRPQVTVNGWVGPAPPVPSQPDSRGVTRGTWRGNNNLYTISIPSGTLVSGTNTIVINVISGSSGDNFLSPNVVLDAIRLY
ncbi:polysaccharide lyase family 4 protein [Macrolepiota fuliginosa MF-IS2]|uniref:rhamnogalacturonan endolyase n=1 Tax=Macrolepiota fuliginosa MF-IS2 TaxID=1400762 RepID=A0A9P5XDH2_9AGAR|nr:polysaccharide lyase family 4 protein [Macrolepiota fuliginosa MF-IS2]